MMLVYFFNLTSGLKKLVIWGHDERCDGSFHYDFVFNIGNNFSVNYEASTFHNDEEPVEFSNEDLDKFLNTVIIKKEFTRKKLR